MTSAFFKASRDGNKKALLKAIKKGVNVDASDPESYVSDLDYSCRFDRAVTITKVYSCSPFQMYFSDSHELHNN